MSPDPLDIIHAQVVTQGESIVELFRDLKYHQLKDEKIHARQSLYFKGLAILLGLVGSLGIYVLKILLNAWLTKGGM